MKSFNTGNDSVLHFWRDKNGVEIDLITQNGLRDDSIMAWEIKAGATYSEDYFKNLKLWTFYSGLSAENCSVVYTGQNALKTKNGALIPWDKTL
jgi:hypothetical protein